MDTWTEKRIAVETENLALKRENDRLKGTLNNIKNICGKFAGDYFDVQEIYILADKALTTKKGGV